MTLSRYMTCSTGRIEAGQQHVVDDHDADVALDAFFLAAEGQLEALDARLVLRARPRTP